MSPRRRKRALNRAAFRAHLEHYKFELRCSRDDPGAILRAAAACTKAAHAFGCPTKGYLQQIEQAADQLDYIFVEKPQLWPTTDA